MRDFLKMIVENNQISDFRKATSTLRSMLGEETDRASRYKYLHLRKPMLNTWVSNGYPEPYEIKQAEPTRRTFNKGVYVNPNGGINYNRLIQRLGSEEEEAEGKMRNKHSLTNSSTTNSTPQSIPERRMGKGESPNRKIAVKHMSINKIGAFKSPVMATHGEQRRNIPSTTKNENNPQIHMTHGTLNGHLKECERGYGSFYSQGKHTEREQRPSTASTHTLSVNQDSKIAHILMERNNNNTGRGINKWQGSMTS